MHLSGRIGNGLLVLQRKSYTGVSYKKEVYGPFVPGDGKEKRYVADAFATDLTFQEKCKKMKEESMKDMEISEHEER